MKVLRDEVGKGGTLWGAFVGTNSPLAAEIMARSGFDWLVVDLQHAPANGPQQLASMLTATSVADVPTLVRIPWKTDFAAAMTALDAGAQGVIVPMLDTADEAAAAAAACKYPPNGFRSFGPWRVGMLHENYAPETGDHHAVCLAQIETRSGMDNVQAILDVPGVDGAYIGPQDLSLSHGGNLNWRTDNALLHDLVERVLKACQEAGKISVAHTADPDDAVHWARLGFDMVTATSDTRLLGIGAASAVRTLHAGMPG